MLDTSKEKVGEGLECEMANFAHLTTSEFPAFQISSGRGEGG